MCLRVKEHGMKNDRVNKRDIRIKVDGAKDLQINRAADMEKDKKRHINKKVPQSKNQSMTRLIPRIWGHYNGKN